MSAKTPFDLMADVVVTSAVATAITAPTDGFGLMLTALFGTMKDALDAMESLRRCDLCGVFVPVEWVSEHDALDARMLALIELEATPR